MEKSQNNFQLFKDQLDNDEPIKNLANFFGQQMAKEAIPSPRKKKKLEPNVNKRQKLGKIEKVGSRLL